MQKIIWSTRITQLVFIISILCSTGLYSQSYQQESGTNQKLIEKAKKTDFKGLTSMISFDKQNNYYAVKTSDIKSRYIKIRILEQSYEDDYIVNIGTFNNLEYLLFLVKKTPDTEKINVEELIDSYNAAAVRELDKLDSEQVRLWLLQHDKYLQ